VVGELRDGAGERVRDPLPGHAPRARVDPAGVALVGASYGFFA
jgi:hypothetical protein